MGHGHAHHHLGHDCPSSGDGGHHSQGRLAIAAAITGLFMLMEAVGGLISGSLALLADAGHMLTDFGALALAWTGFVLAKRPPSKRHHFGLERFQILTAFVNGLTLLALSVWIFIEAVMRLFEPGEVLAGPMLIIAMIGLCVNLFVFWLLLGADRENLNIRGAVLHVLGDLLGSVAAIIAALVIMKTGWVQVDPILSFLVVLLIVKSAWRLTKESAHILLEGAPHAFDVESVEAALLKSCPQLSSVSSLRAWSITLKHTIVIIKADIALSADRPAAAQQVKTYFKDEFGIDDVTIEFSKAQNSS